MKLAQRPAWLRHLAVGLGLLAAAALVWFVGPLVAIAGKVPLASEMARWAAIALLVAAALARVLWRWMRSALRNRGLLAGIATLGAATPAEAAKAGDAEVAVLDQRFVEAMSLLRRSRIGGKRPLLAAMAGRPYVYQLPWYLIVGAPGAGKTTALVNSGLEFPLASHVGDKVLRGIGGTRNCDWWFASEAVLIDTAGRYTTHSSHREADHAAWLGFLGLLRRYRPRRPINGVLLTVSVSDLLGNIPEARLAHAAELRARLDELHRELGIRFPIYVLLTKTDLLAGFMEFFADYDKDERAQVWGVTFPHDGTDPMLLMASEFAALEKRLNACLIDRLHGEPDRERRAAIYAFPQQWRLLRETLYEFLQAVNAGATTDRQPLLRGVYFTSATQEGTPMDRALGGLGRALGLGRRIVAPARPSGKTFFVTRLLRDVVFAEAGLAGTNLRWERQRSLLEWGGVALAVGVVAATAVLGWRSYEANRDHVAAIEAQLPALERHAAAAKASAPSDVVALVPTLDGMDALAQRGGRAPARPDFGLDQRQRLSAAAGDAYQRLLKESFQPRIAARLAQRLERGGQEHVELIYESLRAYLMLFQGSHFDRPALRGYLVADWDATLPAQVRADERAGLRRHLDRLLAGGEVGAPSQADPQLIAGARKLVAGVPLAERTYSRLRQLDYAPQASAFSVESAAGPLSRRVFVRASGQPLDAGVPALYTRTVYERALRPRTQDVLRQFAQEQPWVLGAAAPAAQAEAPAIAAEVERLYLADHAREWDGLVTDLRLVVPADLAATAETAQLLSRPDSPLLALSRALVREAAIAPQAARYESLRRYVEGQHPPAEEALMALGSLSTQLTALDDAVKRKATPPVADAPRALAQAAGRAPEPVRTMLAQLATAGGMQAYALLREPLSRQLAGDVAPACTRAVDGRYPFVRTGKEEVSREDFMRIFGAGGVIDGFYQRNVAVLGELAARDALQPFQQSQAIRDSYFVDGGRRFGLRLELRLIDLDPGVNEFVIDVDGQALRFRRDSRAAQTLAWPGPSGAGRVTVQATGGSGHVFEGPWALLRLLDRVRVEAAPSGDRVHLVFDVEGRKARFDVRSAGPINPALRDVLERYECPKRF